LFNALGLVLEVIATIVIETVAWFAKALFGPSRGKIAGTDVVPLEPSLPKDALAAIVTALKAKQDAPPQLPSGWQGYYIGLADEPSPGAADRVPIGSEVRLVPDPRRSKREPAIRVLVDLRDRSTVQLGYLGEGHDLGPWIEHGHVRCWFAGRMRTLTNPAAAIVFAAAWEP
jgi:hypothetical protein